MPQITEISDGGSNPNFPSVADMRESQRKGSEGKGFSEDTMGESLAKNFNQGSGCPTSA